MLRGAARRTLDRHGRSRQTGRTCPGPAGRPTRRVFPSGLRAGAGDGPPHRHRGAPPEILHRSVAADLAAVGDGDAAPIAFAADSPRALPPRCDGSDPPRPDPVARRPFIRAWRQDRSAGPPGTAVPHAGPGRAGIRRGPHGPALLPLFLPFVITRDGVSGLAYGPFYDNLASAVFDLGCEIDNYHGPYRYYEAEGRRPRLLSGLRALRAGRGRQVRGLTGRMALGPKWSLGYRVDHGLRNGWRRGATSWTFVEQCARRDVPVEDFQLFLRLRTATAGVMSSNGTATISPTLPGSAPRGAGGGQGWPPTSNPVS